VLLLEVFLHRLFSCCNCNIFEKYILVFNRRVNTYLITEDILTGKEEPELFFKREHKDIVIN